MTTIAHVDQLLELAGDSFIHATYATLLGRSPDASGMMYYTNRLKKGYSKESVVCQIAASREATALKRHLNGLQELALREQRARGLLGLLGRIFPQVARMDLRIGRIEYCTDAILEQLADLRALQGNSPRSVTVELPASINAEAHQFQGGAGKTPLEGFLSSDGEKIFNSLLLARARGVA